MPPTAKPGRSPTHALIDDRLVARTSLGTLREFVIAGRRNGTSWRLLTLELRDLTDVDIAHATLILWFGRDPEVAAAYDEFVSSQAV